MTVEIKLGLTDLLAVDRAREGQHTATMTELNDNLARDDAHALALDHLGGFIAQVDVTEVELDGRNFLDTYIVVSRSGHARK